MNKLFVIKESNTFSETIEVLGLAYIVDTIFQKVMPFEKPEILIENKNSYYQISISKDLNQDIIDQCNYFDFFKYIGKKSNDEGIKKYNGIDYKKEKDIRDSYNRLNKKDRERTAQKPHLYYDTIRMCANINAYNKSFSNCRLFENDFSFLLNSIFNFYSSPSIDQGKCKKSLKEGLNSKAIKPAKINSLQDINPDKGKGVSKDKAKGIAPSGQSNFWLQQLIRFTGVWQGFVSGYIKKDFKNYSLVPNNISFEFLKKVYDSFRPFIKGGSSIKLDISLILLLTQKMIEHNKNYNEEWTFEPVNNKISGFQFAYYKNLGQRPAVTNIGFLGLPNFIEFKSGEEGDIWINILKEHLNIIGSINESYSSNISMLQKYRQFISASDFNAFLDCLFIYSSNLIADLNKKKSDKSKQYLKIFTKKNMEDVLMQKQEYSPILQNNGFKNIAKAIRNATIQAQYAKRQKQSIKFPIHYGMAQDLRRKSDFKEEFLKYISDFIAIYNSETARVVENNPVLFEQGKIRATIKTEDVVDLTALVDKFGSPIIGRLLCAYGYSLEASKKE